eukprot:365515-Chlamydomonas_euryale.AAC.5
MRQPRLSTPLSRVFTSDQHTCPAAAPLGSADPPRPLHLAPGCRAALGARCRRYRTAGAPRWAHESADGGGGGGSDSIVTWIRGGRWWRRRWFGRGGGVDLLERFNGHMHPQRHSRFTCRTCGE